MTRLLVLVLFSFSLHAQTFDKILVPIQPGETQGAFGSIWVVTVAMTNISDTPVVVRGVTGLCPVPCELPPLQPQQTFFVTSMLRSDVPAAFLLVEEGRRDDLAITIRVFDRSREHLTWGATLPVITRKELFAHRFGIGDVPVSNAFRSTLRLYDFDATTPAAVRVRIYSTSPQLPFTDQLLAEFHPAFTIPVQGGGTQQHPGYAAIPLWLLPELAGAERVRIVVEPLDASGDHWAFVSSTHNETQHVTVLAPR